MNPSLVRARRRPCRLGGSTSCAGTGGSHEHSLVVSPTHSSYSVPEYTQSQYLLCSTSNPPLLPLLPNPPNSTGAAEKLPGFPPAPVCLPGRPQ